MPPQTSPLARLMRALPVRSRSRPRFTRASPAGAVRGMHVLKVSLNFMRFQSRMRDNSAVHLVWHAMNPINHESSAYR